MGHFSKFVQAWKEESRRRKTQKRKKVETAFLPAALEIMDSPPRPIGRLILWVIVLAGLFAIVWAAFSKVDIVAVAEGRVIPRNKLQTVEVPESGVIRRLLVTEGETVAQGQALIELDPTYAGADANAARSEYSTAMLQKARANALLGYLDGADAIQFDESELAPALALAEKQVVTSRIGEHEAKLDSLFQRLNAADVAGRQAWTQIEQINQTLPLAESQLAARRELADQGYAPRIQVQELEERVTNLRFQRQAQQDEVSKAESEAAMIQKDIAALKEGFRAEAARELSEAEAIIATRSEMLEKAERREALQTLTAPVAGTINEIAITTIGEVAEPGQPLVTIVPTGDELIIQAFVLNRDVGFVEIGQEAIVKLEAYPFMRYGYLVGEVEHVSPDAIIDENRGLVFPARIKIVGSELRLDRVNNTPEAANLVIGSTESVTTYATDYLSILSPGLSAAVEVKTGKRTVLDFLLSPVARATSEAARER